MLIKKASGNRKTSVNKRQKWSFYEDVICCYVYKEYFIINRSTNVKDAINKVKILFKNNKKDTSIDQRLKNIKELMNKNGRSDTFPLVPRTNYSKQTEQAFNLVI